MSIQQSNALPVAEPQPPLPALDQFSGSLTDRVYLSIRRAIVELQYQPGELIRKPAICAAMGVSRSPVSDALARLANDGLVVIHPQSGTYVARLSLDEIKESAFIREALELAAIDRVAAVIDDEQMQLLQRNLTIQKAMLIARDFAGFYKHDVEMHHLILEFSGYPRAIKLLENVQLQIDRARRLVLPKSGRMEDSYAEHMRIFTAIATRDVAGARAAMRHHLDQLVTQLEIVARERPDVFTG